MKNPQKVLLAICSWKSHCGVHHCAALYEIMCIVQFFIRVTTKTVTDVLLNYGLANALSHPPAPITFIESSYGRSNCAIKKKAQLPGTLRLSNVLQLIY